MPAGFFITFEGLDGCGKTTQLERLSATLLARGIPFTSTRQPGGTAFGVRLRALLLDSRLQSLDDGLAPEAELALMFADRAQTIRQVIVPALERDEVVLCDRFTDSSEAYQGAGRELGSERVMALHRALCDDLQPDLTVLLLPPLHDSLRRARRRNDRHLQRSGTDENRFESEDDQFYERVYRAYERIAIREPLRVVTIRSSGSVWEVEAEVLAAVWQRLAHRSAQLVEKGSL